jgi:hypothetical protein
LIHGRNPSTGRINVTTLDHRTARSVKRDIFVTDISGSMHSFLAMTGQIIASLADPRYLSIIMFDTDAVKIDKDVFTDNPAAIFQNPSATLRFAEAAAEKRPADEGGSWNGQGATSYDAAAGVLSKMNLNKGDRVILIGDLEHNTEHYGDKLNELRMDGACNTNYECIAAWYKYLCDKADSCIVINPKESAGGDMTCEMLDYDIPTCLVGAMNAEQELTGDGLRRTVECLREGMTGQKPRIDEKVIEFCKGQGRGDIKQRKIISVKGGGNVTP